MRTTLDHLREALWLARPRSASPIHRRFHFRKDLRMLVSFDLRFNRQYRQQRRLLERGRVVWGAIIEANEALFEPGRHDLPAFVLYSLDPAADAAPERLVQGAGRRFALKWQLTIPSLRQVSSLLAHERSGVAKLPVPPRSHGRFALLLHHAHGDQGSLTTLSTSAERVVRSGRHRWDENVVIRSWRISRYAQ